MTTVRNVLWRRGWDSNPQGAFTPPVFETGPLASSGHPSIGPDYSRSMAPCTEVSGLRRAKRGGEREQGDVRPPVAESQEPADAEGFVAVPVHKNETSVPGPLPFGEPRV